MDSDHTRRTQRATQQDLSAGIGQCGGTGDEVLRSTLQILAPAAVRLVKGSHVVVRRLYAHDRCYILQNKDRRVFFVMPFERDYTLIGTTDRDYRATRPRAATPEEIDYLCDGASEYFVPRRDRRQVVWSYSGVRPLYDDGAGAAQEAYPRLRAQTRRSRAVSAAAQHFRRQDHDLSTTGGGGAGDFVAPPARGAQACRLDGSRPVAWRRVSRRRLRSAGERNGGALSFSRAGRGSSPGSRLRRPSAEAVGRGEDAFGSRTDFRRPTLPRSRFSTSPRTNGR